MLDFLKNVQIVPQEAAASSKKVAVVKTAKDNSIPENVDLRVYANGRITPSDKFVARYNLEYTTKEDASRNGIDLIDGTLMPGLKSADGSVVPSIFIAITPKSEPKVDLWANCKYAEDGTTTATVASQHCKDSGLELLENLARLNGTTVEDLLTVEGYVDLTVVNQAFDFGNGIYLIPKKVARGAQKGEPTYARRENIALFPLVLTSQTILDIKEDETEGYTEIKTTLPGTNVAFQTNLAVGGSSSSFVNTGN